MRLIGGTAHNATGGGYFDCRPTDEGEVQLHGLRAGARLELAVLDRRHQALVKRRVVVPRAPHDLTIELRVAHVAIRLGGRVVDEAAQPVAGAEVRLVGESGTAYGYTDKGGKFRFDPLSATGETAHFLVVARGFAPLRSQPLRLSADIQPVELRLAKGHDVTVAVVDSEGERVTGTEVRVDDQRSESSRGRRLEPGLWRFEDLALADVTFWTTIGWRRFDCRQSSALEKARIVVPVLGTLEVTAPRGLLPAEGRLSARLFSSGGKEAINWTLAGKGKTLTSGKRPLIPGDYSVELFASHSSEVVGARRKVRITARGRAKCRFGK